jgi:large subunit ribosomal protein L10
MSRAKKEQLVADYAEKLTRSEAIILANHQGLDVAQISELRHRLRAAGTGFQVTKNTLLRRALEEAKLPDMDALLEGPTAASFCYQEVQRAIQVLVEYTREAGPFTIRGGLLGQRLLSGEDINRLAALPSREILLSQLLAAFQSPMRGMVNVLSGSLRGLTTVLKARADQLAASES